MMQYVSSLLVDRQGPCATLVLRELKSGLGITALTLGLVIPKRTGWGTA